MDPKERMKINDRYEVDSDEDEVEFSKPGSIVRLKFKNFMQYTETEFHCGPNLNTIVGPNGSGKSSIVNGICLGLAGKPSVLNRATTLGEFVRIGAEVASIEVELYHPAEGNLVVFRQFDRTNKSMWKLNGQKSGLREVERKVAEMRIQVDNLCQFLPQDRIHEFSTLNNKGLLDSTVDAVGDVDLKTKHSELKQLQKTMNEGKELYDKRKQMMEEKVEQCRRLEEDVKAFEEKKDLEEKIEVAKGKLAWSKYYEVREVTKKISEKYKEVEDSYRKEKSKLQPMESSVAAVSSKKEKLLRKKQSLNNTQRDQLHRIRVQTENIDMLIFSIRDTVDQIEGLEQVEEAKREEIRKMKTVIEEMEQEVSSSQDDPNLGPQLERANRKTQDVQRELEKVFADSDNLKYEERRLSIDIKYRKQELVKLSDVEDLKVGKLKEFGGDDCFKSLKWLRQNKQDFRGAVYEPFIISSNVKNPALCKYVEHVIYTKDLTAFLFEDACDMNHFLNMTRNTLGLRRVNAVQVPRESLQAFEPNINGNDLKKFGFVSYVKDLISAPDQVVSFMCKQYGLHRIPVFSEEGEQYHDNFVEMGFTKFFVGNKIQSISGSRYSTARTTLTKEVVARGQLDISKDDARERIIKDEMKKIEEKVNELNNESAACQEKIQSLQVALETSRKNEALLQRKKNYKAQQGAKIESHRRLLRQKLSEQNCNEVRPALQAKIRDLISRQVSSTKQLQLLISNNSTLKTELDICSINLQPLDEIIQRKELEMSQAAESLKEMESAVRDCKEELDESVDTMNAILRQAWDETGRNSRNYHEPPQDVKEAWEVREIPAGVDLIETLIIELQAKADCMDNIDRRIVREYRELKETIKELDQDIKLRDAAMGENEEKTNLLKKSWLEALETLIEKINTNFSSYFSSMGYAGEVGLMKGSHENDFENYGISIRVKFRDSEPLEELTGSRQSGGERSVSTALYMLALQQVTSVPFRCVDEINQGMDARNERLVFNLLVRTSCHQTSSQYFLLTPKLLAGLDYSTRMNVLFVYNGRAMCNYRSWDMESFGNLLRE